MFSILSSFVLLTVTGYRGILITARDIAARVTAFLGCLGFDLIDLLWFTALT